MLFVFSDTQYIYDFATFHLFTPPSNVKKGSAAEKTRGATELVGMLGKSFYGNAVAENRL